MKYDYSCRYSSPGGSKEQDPPCLTVRRVRKAGPALRLSVLRLRWIDLVDPLQNPTLEVLHVREAHRLQEILGLRAAASHLALRHDLAILRQFLIPPGQLTERN